MRIARTALCAVILTNALALLAHDSKQQLNYVYTLEGGKQQVLASGSLNIDNLERITRLYGGRYFWFSLDGRSYVIRDPATLAEIDRTFSPMRALEPERDAIRRRLEPLEREESALDRKVDALEDSIDEENEPESTMRAVEAEVRKLEARLRTIEQQMRVIEREEERMDLKFDAIEEEAERQLLPILRRAIREGRAAKA